MPTEETEMEVLHDHYKDSFAHIREYIGIRDRLLLFILILITLMLFDLFSPEESSAVMSQFICSKFGLETPVNISFLGNILWFGMVALCVKYFQTVIYIERQYAYLEKIEGALNSKFGGDLFTREGKSYLRNYPLFSDWSHILYTVIFPVILFAVLFSKITNEIGKVGKFSWFLSFNVIAFVCVAVSIGLYLISFHLKRRKEEDK